MADDGHPIALRILHRPALHPILGELRRLLIGALGHPVGLHPDRMTRHIHHREHIAKAVIGLAHQIPDRAVFLAVLQQGGRAGMDADFVLQRQHLDLVAFGFPVAGQVFGHQK